MKKNIEISISLFFQIWTYFGPDFVPKTIPTLLFLADFQWSMLGDSININNLCCIPVVLKKKLVKHLKNCFLGHKKGVNGTHPTWKTIFLAEITKADHKFLDYNKQQQVLDLTNRLNDVVIYGYCWMHHQCYQMAKIKINVSN